MFVDFWINESDQLFWEIHTIIYNHDVQNAQNKSSKAEKCKIGQRAPFAASAEILFQQTRNIGLGGAHERHDSKPQKGV